MPSRSSASSSRIRASALLAAAATLRALFLRTSAAVAPSTTMQAIPRAGPVTANENQAAG